MLSLGYLDVSFLTVFKAILLKDSYNTCMNQLIKNIFALTGMDIKLKNEENENNKKGFLQNLFKKD